MVYDLRKYTSGTHQGTQATPTANGELVRLMEEQKGMSFIDYERTVFQKPKHSWDEEQYFFRWDEYDTLRELYIEEWNRRKRSSGMDVLFTTMQNASIYHLPRLVQACKDGSLAQALRSVPVPAFSSAYGWS